MCPIQLVGRLFSIVSDMLQRLLQKSPRLREAQTLVVTGFENFQDLFCDILTEMVFRVRSFNLVSSVHRVKIEFCKGPSSISEIIENNRQAEAVTIYLTHLS